MWCGGAAGLCLALVRAERLVAPGRVTSAVEGAGAGKRQADGRTAVTGAEDLGFVDLQERNRKGLECRGRACLLIPEAVGEPPKVSEP